MGADKIKDKELDDLGVEIKEHKESGSRALIFSEKSLPQYIGLIQGKLNNGFWNEVVSKEKILFIFKFKDGLIKEIELTQETEKEISKLCSELNGDPLEKTSNVYKYISGNDFYHDFMMENYKEMTER